MTPTPENEKRVTDALLATVKAASACIGPDDFDSIRRKLNEVWFAVHDAQQTLNTVERETREAAIAQVERAA